MKKVLIICLTCLLTSCQKTAITVMPKHTIPGLDSILVADETWFVPKYNTVCTFNEAYAEVLISNNYRLVQITTDSWTFVAFPL